MKLDIASPFLFADFNQDNGCFAVGTQKGFRIYNTDPLRENYSCSESGGVGFAEMLFRCNYVAFVGGGSRPMAPLHKVLIWDDLKKRSVIELDFSSEIKSVRLRRDKIVVVLHNLIKVFTFTSSPKQLHVFDTGPNPRGLCSLSPSSSNSYLAFPSDNCKGGTVKIVDLSLHDKEPLIIPAHESSLNCLKFNVQGCKLATASTKGTLIRVFESRSGQLLAEFRRGSQPATIHSLNFNFDSSLLCVSSSHGTIHIFGVSNRRMNKSSAMATPFLTSNHLLPKYFSSQWSFSRIEVPGGLQCIAAFGHEKDSVIAICADGSYHKFKFSVGGTFSREVYHMFLE